MLRAPLEVYVDAFAARCAARRSAGQTSVDAPGIRGLLGCADDPSARLLVTDDRGRDALGALLAEVRAGVIDVLAGAPGCARLLEARPGWTARPVTAMVCRDLAAVAVRPLPSELALRSVRRQGDEDAADGVSLRDAVAAARSADPGSEASADAFAAFLRSLGPEFRLFAAVDDGGVVRATGGYGTFGSQASVLFVNTVSGWRRRGIAAAMTGAALQAARDAGATQACLNASGPGRSVYRRLGFETAGAATHFACVAQ